MIFALIIAIASSAEQSRKNKDNQKKMSEQANFYAEMRRREEETKRHLEEFYREERQKGAAKFNEELSAIPKVDIERINSEQDLTNYLDFPSDQLKILKPRSGSRKSLYTDFTVVDVETTGLDECDDIIEISAIKYVDLKPVSAFTSLVKPRGIIPSKIVSLTGISSSMVANAPAINQIMPAFIEYIGDDNILAHNLSFDLKFLYRAGFNCFALKRRYYDTLGIARSKLSKEDVENFKLPTLCDHYKIYRNDAHRSLSDCFATAQIYIELLREYDLKNE